MAKKIENKKGFEVIEVSLSEVHSFGGLGICDYCSKAFFKGYYIAVLNSCYCESCYNDFNQRSKYYPEDRKTELRNMERMSKVLGMDNN